MEQHYWFISYVWRRRGEPHYLYAVALTQKHPLYWMAKNNDVSNVEYVIISYQAITKDEYDEYRDLLN